MKTVLVAINAKYIHSALAPWCLKAFCGENAGEITVLEFNINNDTEMMLYSIYNEKADVAAFSCYIWNIGIVLKLCENIKKISPSIKIILGGPEVSYDCDEILETHPYADFIISGEGEQVFCGLLTKIAAGDMAFHELKGLAYRQNGRTYFDGTFNIINDPAILPSPYTGEMLTDLKGRIIYAESSRGCAFSCAYCLSSTFEGIRYLPISRVFDDIERIVGSGALQIKFTDRTFNSSRDRAAEILDFLISKKEWYGHVNFHFEAAADLFNNTLLSIAGSAPQGYIQFEIGIQSVNPVTLAAVCRKTDLDKAFSNIKILREAANIHLHLDLIAGLPYEDYNSFTRSFNDVYGLKPHMLQLGFLKLLKGSGLRSHSDIHGYFYRSYPPYEILSNNYINYEELARLKKIEEVVGKYHNSGKYQKTLEYMAECLFDTPFDFFHELGEYFFTRTIHGNGVSSRQCLEILAGFIKERAEGRYLLLINLMKLDYLASSSERNIPDILVEKNCSPDSPDRLELLRRNKNFFRTKQYFEVFDYDVTLTGNHYEMPVSKTVIMFDYTNRNSVSGLYKYSKVFF